MCRNGESVNEEALAVVCREVAGLPMTPVVVHVVLNVLAEAMTLEVLYEVCKRQIPGMAVSEGM